MVIKPDQSVICKKCNRRDASSCRVCYGHCDLLISRRCCTGSGVIQGARGDKTDVQAAGKTRQHGRLTSLARSRSKASSGEPACHLDTNHCLKLSLRQLYRLASNKRLCTTPDSH